MLSSFAVPLSEENNAQASALLRANRTGLLEEVSVEASLLNVIDVIRREEADGVSREEICCRFADWRQLLAQSPILERTQLWPRGYQGDFETIETLVAGVPSADQGDVIPQLEQCIFASPVVQQHRNKIAVQGAVAAEVMRARRDCEDGRILSIACGGSSDMAEALSLHTGFRGEIVINDQDQGALDLSLKRLAAADSLARVTVCKGNVLQLLRRPASLGLCDLVIAGGLCDYLEERPLAFLLRQVWECLLKPGGVFFWTNIASGNPYRYWMEYLADWFLIERTEASIVQSCILAGIPRTCIRLTLDATGLTWLVEITKPR